MALSPRDLAAELRDQGITVLFLTAALFHQMAHEAPRAFAGVRTLLAGGQEVEPAPARRVLDQGPPERLLNGYGPTESTTFAVVGPIEELETRRKSVPIGRPIANTWIHILDRGLRPVPVGVPGRLHIGGHGLGRGYWRRPELTAERFVPDPFGGAGARLYDSGDLARFLPDGRIQFLGRSDHQVKIRGFRIELGEIESALTEHPEIAEAVVLARQDGPGERRLVAYLVPRPGGGSEAVLGAAAREYLRHRLPEYMLPAAFVILGSLPLTPNGKVDRAALPAPDAAARSVQAGFAPPQTFAEQLLAESWAELLGLDRVGRHDDFFELGGHSLLATRAVSRARRSFGVEVRSPEPVPEHPTVAGLALEIEAALQGGGAVERPAIEPADRSGELPLSFAQQRLWFLDQLEPGGAYNIPLALRCRQALDAAGLEWAVGRIVRRHEALRTRFEMADGRPVQRIEPAPPVRLPVIDLRGLPDGRRLAAARLLAREESVRPFDLRRGPLLRLLFLRLGEEDQVVLLTMHHVVSDGWSMGVFLREAEELYAAHAERREPRLPELPVQYADFASWQRRWLSGEVLADHLAFARRRFGGELPVLDLPADAPPPERSDFRGGAASRVLPEPLVGALRILGREQGCTLAMALLAGFEVLLHRLSGQSDLILGMAIANRNHYEIEGLIGFFVNTLALRTDLSGDPAFRTVLDRVREVALESYAHQDLPFERLVEEVQPERSLGRHPLFEVVFNHLSASGESWEASRLAFEPLEIEEPEAKLPLTLYLAEAAGGVSLRIVYQRARFSAARIDRLLDQLEHLFGQLAESPDLPIRSHSLVTPEARLVLPDPAAPLPEPAFDPVVDLVLSRAVRSPELPAVRENGVAWSYGVLAARVEEAARALVSSGLGRGEVVAVSGERGFGLIVSILAVLRSGGVLLTLDPDLPEARRLLVLSTAGARRMLHAGPVPAGDGWLQEACPATIEVEADTGRIASPWAGPEEAPLPTVSPEDPAYLFFTSGTTGDPKGVVGLHKSLSHFIDWQRRSFGIGEGDRGPLLISLSFDAVLRDLFLPLTSGACLHLPEKGADVVRWLEGEGITYLHTVPAVAQSWLSELPPGARLSRLRWAFFSGEPLTDALIARWRAAFPSAEVVSFYGATEATMIQSFFRVPCPALPGVQPVGRPLPDTQLLVLSESGGLCGFGEPGEVCVRTPFLTRGYLNAPEDQARSFVANPLRDDHGDLLYRTGDRGRYRPDGTLEVLGRLDQQVKIRGVRVEPEEVAANLLRHPEVQAAVVIPWRGERGETSLAAYAVAEGDGATRPDLRAFLEERLPAALVPASFTWLDCLPLTATGKVDRRALPAPEERGEGSLAQPRTLAEEVLAALWSEVLGGIAVGPEDDFFELGGHSLLATRIMARVSRVFRVDLPLRTLFEAPRLRAFAARIEAARQSGARELPAIERSPGRGARPLSFGQQRLWFFEQLESGRAVYNVPLRLRMVGRLDVAALVGTLREVVRRHEVLRTRFASEEGRAVQVVEASSAVPLAVVDLSALPEPARLRETRRVARLETGRPFDLGRPPLLRMLLMRLGQEEHEAVLTMHHIASDGWSLGVLVREVEALYRRLATGKGEAPLPELPIQYGDFARWQREWLRGEILEAQLAYWRGQLAGSAEILELPTDRPRPAVQSFRGARRPFRLSGELAAGLSRLSRGRGATLFMTLLAGFEALLYRVTGQTDLSVGTPVAGRTRVETEDLVGFFVNTLVLRTELAGSWSFGQLLERVREVSLEAHAHQEVPFERLVEELRPVRDLGRTPLFQVMFALQNAPLGDLSLPGLSLSPVEVPVETAKFDLELTLGERAGGLWGWWTYSTDLFDPATIARLEDHLTRLLAGGVSSPESSLEGLAMLSEAERHQLRAEWNDTALPEPGATMVELIELPGGVTAGRAGTSLRGRGTELRGARRPGESPGMAAALVGCGNREPGGPVR